METGTVGFYPIKRALEAGVIGVFIIIPPGIFCPNSSRLNYEGFSHDYLIVHTKLCARFGSQVKCDVDDNLLRNPQILGKMMVGLGETPNAW